MFWAWSDWEESVHLASASGAEPPKPNEEAFSIQDPKSRSFVQARQAVKARNLSRGFYLFNPSIKALRAKERAKEKERCRHPHELR